MAFAVPLFASEKQWRALVSSLLGGLPSSRIIGTAIYDPPNLAANATTTTTVTVTGATLGQSASAWFSLDTQGIWLQANVSAADTVRVSLWNATAGAINLASGTLSAAVWTD
jgi:hypothetical protein